jgi:hypothetical protein
MELSKEYLLKNSKTFCMFPWIHLHTTPEGIAAPCCIADVKNNDLDTTAFGNSRSSGLMELVNSSEMNQLRLDMINGIKSKHCAKCYMHEDQIIDSHRNFANREYGEYFEKAFSYTDLETGSLKKFEMVYFDIRFSNICNFKCRTCGSGFSSQWEQEDLANNLSYAKSIPKNDNKQFLKDVIEQIDFMQTAYFAGGEPLITEEHYIMLEEMIKRGKTDIVLRYNTNLSNLKFKNKDIFGLWKHFKNKIIINASIDHIGKRAEYIRHGTDWGLVETNFLNAKSKPYISLRMNTVLSIFNYLSLTEFYEYLINHNMFTGDDETFSLYPMMTPTYLSAHILPKTYKQKGREGMTKIVQILKDSSIKEFNIGHIAESSAWVESLNSWHVECTKFKSEIERLDKIRNENFVDVFPELAQLLDTPVDVDQI